jgi:hypothetical protein
MSDIESSAGSHKTARATGQSFHNGNPFQAQGDGNGKAGVLITGNALSYHDFQLSSLISVIPHSFFLSDRILNGS